MSQTVITQAFEELKAQEAANGGVLTLDEFVFASVPDLNITDPIDRTEGLPPAAQIVHRQAVSKTGMVNSNAVVYSVVLGADVGDFEFNWVGLLNKASGVVAMIVHAPSQKKIRTQSGQQGNVLTRSFLMEYNGASQQTQIITPADTWQIDFTARLNGVDERIRQENFDTYGSASFLSEGFLTSGNNGSYQVKKGIAYIEGLRAELLFDQTVAVVSRPSKIWIDVCWRGTLTSVWATATKLTVADTLENYVTGDEQHFVFAIAEILADGSVIDLRQSSPLAEMAGIEASPNVILYFDKNSKLKKTALSSYIREMLASPDAAGVLEDLGLSGPGGAGLVGGSITPITAKFLAGGAVSGQDASAAVQAACDMGGTFYVPKGEYIVSSVHITKDITFICEKGSVFKRAPGLDIRQSYWAPGVAMFDAVADGLNVTFVDPVFDGNKLNQPAVQVGYSGPDATTEPAGWTFRYSPVNAATARNCKFNFIRPVFRNGTSGYLLIRGDDVRRRFKTEVVLDNAKFTDTIYGYGKGDPSTPTPLGWNSDYFTAYDYLDIYASNLFMSYGGVPTAVGKYAPVGIRGTFYGTDVANAGGVSIYAVGKTTLNGLGRKSQSYDGANFTNSNGIGAIDGYGDCRNFYFDSVVADNCENVPVRAKATISNYHINSAVLRNCRRGLQVSPASSGNIEGNVYVGNVECYGGWNPQVEFIGNSPSDKLKGVHIGRAVITGGINGEGLTGNIGGVVIRNVKTLTGLLEVENQDDYGLYLNACDMFDLNVRIDNAAKSGVNALLTAPCSGELKATVKNSGGYGVTLTGSCSDILVSADIDGAVDYGVYAALSAGNVVIDRAAARNITGNNRGYYIGAANGTIANCYADPGMSTPVGASDLGQIVQHNNSWNPRADLYKLGIGAPTTGSFRKGDIVYMPPASGGYLGWVCIVAGVAGSTAVFKRFGAIEA